MKLYTLLGLALTLTSATIFSLDNSNEGYFEIKIPALENIEKTQKTLDFATRNLLTMGTHLNGTLEQLPANIATMVDQRLEKVKKELTVRPKQLGIIAASLPFIYYAVPFFEKGIKSAVRKENGETKIKPGLDTAYYIGAGALLSVAGFFGIIKSDTIAECKLSDITPSFLKK